MRQNFAYIHPDAKIGANVQIKPFAVIHGDVIIGDNTIIESHAIIMDGTRIGNNCHIFPSALVGSIPKDKKFEGEYSILEIHDNVIIREFCSVNRGTKATFKTVIKENALLMAYVHVAHDCVIGKNVVLANNVQLAGHITIGDHAILGGLSAVHQFVKIGEHAMISGGSLVRKDVPPYVKAANQPLSYIGVNSIGLRRRGFDSKDIHHIQDIYRFLFVKGLNNKMALTTIKQEIKPSYYRENILSFIESSERGIMKGFRSINGNSVSKVRK